MTGAPPEICAAVEAKLLAWMEDPPDANEVKLDDGEILLRFGRTDRLVVYAQRRTRLRWWGRVETYWVCRVWLFFQGVRCDVEAGDVGLRFVEAWRAKHEQDAARAVAARVEAL